MADTVTTKLGMTKPEIGASNNTWGTKLNGNFDILDSKVVRNSIQWSVTPGDDNPASISGSFIVTRYNNSAVRVDDPLVINRQTGAVAINNLNLPGQGAAPAAPVASVTMWCDGNNNVYVTKPDGTNQYLGPPPGTIMYTAANSADVGWALCNGQTVPKAANPALWARIGNTFGGDANNIGLPDIRGRVVAHVDGGAGRLVNIISGAYGVAGGSDINALTAAQIPGHTHGYSGSAVTGTENQTHTHNYNIPNSTNTQAQIVAGASAFFWTGGPGTGPTGPENQNHNHNFSWSGNTDGGAGLSGASHNNVQPTIVLNAQIKLG